MGPSEQAYNIQSIGNWPYEKYKITPIESEINPTLGYIIFENNFPYYNNVGNNFKGYTDYDFGAVPIAYDFDEYRYRIDLSAGNSFYFSASTTRKYFNGYVYNKFIIELDPNAQQKGYVLYPTRLFLKPLEASKTLTGWRLKTSAILLSATPQYFQTTDQDLSSQKINQQYYSNYSGKIEIPIAPVLPVSISYQICAGQQINNREILRFTETYNPFQLNKNLEDAGTIIKPDSTHIYYRHNYYDPFNVFSEISEIPAYNLEDSPYTVYILNYKPDLDPNKQTFYLLQSAIDLRENFNTSTNCVLTAVLDVKTTNFKYFAATRNISPGTKVSVISGVPNSFLGARYVTDSPKIKNTNEDVSATVTYTNAAGAYSLFSDIASTINGFDVVTWDLKYPPHYYNFNILFSDSSYYNKKSQESYLSFKLSSTPISLTTNTVILSTYIYSDFQLLKLDLKTYGILDYIKFDITSNLELFLSSLCCYYGDDEVPYYALDPKWIPAVSGNLFKITYPDLEYGEIQLNIFPTLSTLAGYIEPYFYTDVILNKGGSQTGGEGVPIFQTIFLEDADYLESYVTDSSITQTITGLSENASRSLSGSNISWFWTPQDAHIQLRSADTHELINYGETIPFSFDTYRTVLSGYGPQTIVLSVSSQKYNEVSSITSTSALFDPFLEKRFVIGSFSGLDNKNITRYINLTAAVPYKDRVYPLPNNYPIFWYWKYDGTDSQIPVSAYNLSSVYNQSQVSTSNTLSTIDIFVEPPKTNLGEILHNIDITLQSSIDNIAGTYSFSVDEFPDSTVLDTNFYTYYQNLSNSPISSTYTSKILTRPLDSTAKYNFRVNNNISNNSKLVWTIQDSLGSLSSLSATNSIYYDITGARITYITLSALNITANGWVSSHNISTTLTIYSLPPIEFDQPLLFNIYPEFYWLSGKNLDISNIYNYTNSSAPTAYKNTVTNTYNFWVSANKSYKFDKYIYSVDVPQTSSISLLTIPYDNKFLEDSGFPISLTAFGTEFPESNGLFYQISSTTGLVTRSFNITSQSLAFDIGGNSFYKSPKLLQYNTSVFTFSATVTSLNVDTNRYIYVDQNVYSDPINSPDQPNGGTIEYTLSSAYWTSTTKIDAQTGLFRLFGLSIGDAYIPLTINDKESTTMYLTASAYIEKIIPETTFENYPSYTKDKNLWLTVGSPVTSNKVETLFAYTTSGKIGIYISEYYTLTGNDITFGVDDVYQGTENDIAYYNLDYGDNNTDILYGEEYKKHSYSVAGSYNITLSSVYQNGDLRVTFLDKPIIIYNDWNRYDQSEIRLLDETSLTFPYSLEQVDIQPNEFGNADIFNTSVSRLQQNLDYIISNSRTLNTNTPTDVYGWLGTNTAFKSKGIEWHTTDYNSDYYNNTNLATSEGIDYFTDIRSFSEIGDQLIVLDGNRIRYFINSKKPIEYTFSNYAEFLKDFSDINYMESNDTGDVVFVTDTAKNKIHRIELDVAQISYIFDILDIGGFGSKEEPNKFNSPNKLVYNNSYIYVLDYGNRCVKKYTDQLAWVYTYGSSLSAAQPIESFDIHSDTGFVYALTKDRNIIIFDTDTVEPFSSLYVGNIIDSGDIYDFRFDEAGEFFYIVTSNRIYKFSASGIYIGVVDAYSGMRHIKNGRNRSILTSTKNYILKMTDIVEMFGIGDGASKTGWTIEQLLMSSDEFPTDTNYNRCLQRLVDNIKKYRDSIDSKFVLVTESTKSGTVTYFANQPIKISDRPMFSDDLENNRVRIGVNELHVPQVFNREFSKIYAALETLRSFSEIKTINASTTDGCQGVFCWSWKAMSCYNLTLPVIKLCNINPITFAELKSSFSVSYAPTKTWGEAVSVCCEGKNPPII